MPRQRMVKPEFFDSESLGACSIKARYCFIGLWVVSNDFGNLKMQPSRIRMKIFPYDVMDDAEFVGLLDELEQVGCIKGYEADGERFINIPNFSVYQTVRKPSATSIPEPPEGTVKAKCTSTIHQWRTGDAPVTHYDGTSDAPVSHQWGSTSLVQHYDVTSTAERKKERREGSTTSTSFSKGKNGAHGAAEADGSAPPSAPDGSVRPVCPLCSKPVRFSPASGKWRCEMCGDVKEPAYAPWEDAS